jgi:hypothetical protein
MLQFIAVQKSFFQRLTGFRRVLVNQVGFYAQIPD